MKKKKKFDCGCEFDVTLDSTGKMIGLDWDPSKVKLDCGKTWGMVCQGLTGGVFQLDKYLGKKYSKEIQPLSIEEWAALISIIRPGTLDAELDGKKLSDVFVERKFGRMDTYYEHPDLEPILKTTNGIMVYQEQAIKIAKELAGFSGNEADIYVRKCISRDSIFHTEHGPMSIEEICNSDKKIKVLTVNNDGKNIFKEISKAWKQKNKRRTLKITSNGRTIRCTYDHKILTNNGWKEAQCLTLDDYICSIDRFKTVKTVKQVIDPDLATLYAYFISEGCYTDKSLLKITNADLEIIEKITSIYEKAAYLNTIIDSDLLEEVLNYDFKYSKITKIEKYGKEEVYDFTIDEETPWAYVNGIIVHNSIGKKNLDLIEKAKKMFIAGCAKNNINEETANVIFGGIEASGRYAFNKSHAVAYALDGYYYSAYPKAHFPKVFYCTELDNAKDPRLTKQEKICEIIEDAALMGVKIAPPDIRYRNYHSVIDKNNVVIGLGNMKYVNESCIDVLPEQKVSYYEFLYNHLNKINSLCAESLIKSGSCDFFNVPRRQMYYELKEVINNLSEEIIDYLSKNKFKLLDGLKNILTLPTGKGKLCHSIVSKRKIENLIKKLEHPPTSLNDTIGQKLFWEREFIGREFTPLNLGDLSMLKNRKTCRQISKIHGDKVDKISAAVIIREVKKCKTKKKQEDMAFLIAYDATGASTNIVIFPESYAKYEHLLAPEEKVILEGRSNKDSFSVEKVIPL